MIQVIHYPKQEERKLNITAVRLLKSIDMTGSLRTFARKFSTTQIFFILLLQSDNELPMSEIEKPGAHRLRFRNKTREKPP